MIIYIPYSIVRKTVDSDYSLYRYVTYLLGTSNVTTEKSVLFEGTNGEPDKEIHKNADVIMFLLNPNNYSSPLFHKEYELLTKADLTGTRFMFILDNRAIDEEKDEIRIALDNWAAKHKSVKNENNKAYRKNLNHLLNSLNSKNCISVNQGGSFGHNLILQKLNIVLKEKNEQDTEKKRKAILIWFILALLAAVLIWFAVPYFITDTSNQKQKAVLKDTHLPKQKAHITTKDTLLEAPVTIRKKAVKKVNSTKKDATDAKRLQLERYRKILATADKRLEQMAYIEARKLYEEAGLLINADYPKLKITEIDLELKEIARKNMLADNAVIIPTGIFYMGSDSGDWDEQPVHKVKLDKFVISKYEVTVGEYKAFCKLTGIEMPAIPKWGWIDEHPIVNVSWNDANEYAKWIGKRLPTQAEWEFAARGGDKSKNYIYSGSNDIDEVAWHEKNANNTTHQVALKKPNELGLYDMTGNVWEWCADWYEEDYYSISPGNNPKGATKGEKKVLRGGSWYSYDKYCRMTYHSNGKPDFKYSHIGFRLAWDAE